MKNHEVLELGEPLNLKRVAELIGCSPWTVRQRHLPAGLPHVRAGASGKLIFYRDQVVRWILENQKKGGEMRWGYGGAATSIGPTSTLTGSGTRFQQARATRDRLNSYSKSSNRKPISAGTKLSRPTGA